MLRINEIRLPLGHSEDALAAAIQKKLKLPAYDPNKWGKSGDRRMEKLMAMPLEQRAEALYGVAAD